VFISIKKWLQTNCLGAAAQLTVESVKNTRSAAPNPPCCEILVSKDCSKLAERKYRQSCEIQVDFFMFISIKKWLQTNYLGAAAHLTVESVKNTRSAAPNPPCCEILVSKDYSKLA